MMEAHLSATLLSADNWTWCQNLRDCYMKIMLTIKELTKDLKFNKNCNETGIEFS
jgi:hypothetical protein